LLSNDKKVLTNRIKGGIISMFPRESIEKTRAQKKLKKSKKLLTNGCESGIIKMFQEGQKNFRKA
jgi:hypothetical protein